jgi:hypothetical protein
MQRNEEKSSQNNTALITSTTSTGLQINQRNRRKMSLKRIPVLIDEQNQQLFNGDLIHFRDSYIYDGGERAGRHYAARHVIYDLYDIGAKIINDKETRLEAMLSTAYKEVPELSPVVTDASSISLMSIYNNLPRHVSINGRHKGTDPLHGLFIFRIALDSLDANHVYEIFKQLEKGTAKMTFGVGEATLPDRSVFLDEHVAIDFIREYIHYNSERFTFLELTKLNKISKHVISSGSLAGGFVSGLGVGAGNETLYEDYRKLMSSSIPQLYQALTVQPSITPPAVTGCSESPPQTSSTQPNKRQSTGKHTTFYKPRRRSEEEENNESEKESVNICC